MSLRPYQHDAIGAIAGALAEGQNRLLMQMATGLGKTRTFAELLDHSALDGWRVGKRPRTLVIAHREELLDQSAETIRKVSPGRTVDIEQGARYANRFADVVVASIQTLAASKCRRLHSLLRAGGFGTVIIDEAHHAAAPSYRTVLVHLGFLPASDASEAEDAEEVDAAELEADLRAWDAVAPKDRMLLGVTATPNRSDAIGLGCVFQSIAFTYPIRRAVTDGWLVNPVPWVVDTSTNLDGVRTQRGDFNQRELADAVNTEDRNRLAVDGWHKYAHERPTLAFTVDVQHAYDLAAAFRARGVEARAVSGQTPTDERRQLLEDYRQGRVRVVTNCMILTEGTDLPMTSCILHAKPTKSATLYEQMTGRGLRLHPGKTDCIILDVVDVAKRHSLQTAASLYGLPPGLSGSKGQTLNELADAWDAFATKYPTVDAAKMGRIDIDQLKVKASTFDLWAVPSLGAFGAGRLLNWVKTAVDTFRVSYPFQEGTETIEVAPDLLGKFSVVGTYRSLTGVKQRTMVAGLEDARTAAEFAEKFILAERREVSRMIDAGAKWQKDPATEGQKKFLRWKRIPFREDISKGDASKLISLAKARSGQ